MKSSVKVVLVLEVNCDTLCTLITVVKHLAVIMRCYVVSRTPPCSLAMVAGGKFA